MPILIDLLSARATMGAASAAAVPVAALLSSIRRLRQVMPPCVIGLPPIVDVPETKRPRLDASVAYVLIERPLLDGKFGASNEGSQLIQGANSPSYY